jgi:hypothetical protein
MFSRKHGAHTVSSFHKVCCTLCPASHKEFPEELHDYPHILSQQELCRADNLQNGRDELLHGHKPVEKNTNHMFMLKLHYIEHLLINQQIKSNN